jgi:phage terminase large subunit
VPPRRQHVDIAIQTAEVFEPLLDPMRYKGAYGGRGSGKSQFFADNAIEWALTRPRTRGLFVREHQTSLMQSVKPMHERRIQEVGAGRYFDVQRDRIVTPGGGEFVYHGMANHNAESVKSFENFDFAHVEEAQTFSQRSLTLLTPTIRKPGSEIWFSWNRRDPKDPVDVFFREGRPNAISVRVNYADNPWFPEVLRADMEFDKRRDYDRYLHVWEGAYLKHSAARVFSKWRVGDPSEFLPRSEVDRLFYGGDFGFSVDPAVLLEMYIKGRALYISAEAYGIGVEIDYLPFLFGGCSDPELVKKNAQAWATLEQSKKNAWQGIPGSRRWPCTADSSRPDTISYLNRHGYPLIYPSKKGKGSIEEGVEFIKSFDVVIHPSCTHTIDEFTHYSFKTDPKTEEVLPVLEDAHNHVIDAARYALEKLRRTKIGVH